jgi:hypothetical protein
MTSWAQWTAKTVLVTTGFAAAGGGFAGVAFAGTAGVTAVGNLSVLSGYQASIPVSIPVDICGNAAALLGIAVAGCQGGAEVVTHHGPAADYGRPAGGLSAGNLSVGSGNSVEIPVKIAANVCGNAIGHARAGCQGGAYVPADGSIEKAGPAAGGLSVGNDSVGSGNSVDAPVSVPADICGNAAAVLGASNVGCAGGAAIGGRHRDGAGDPSRLLSSTQLAGLGALPGVANLPTLAGLSELPLVNGLTSGSLLPASTLSAFSSDVTSGGMSGNSFATLAIGALLAGAAALKIAGRRSRARKPGTSEVSA